MIGWLVRLVLIIAGVVAAWFVPRDSINFSVIQIGVVLVAVLLIAIGSLGIPRVAALLREWIGHKNGNGTHPSAH